MIGIGMKGGINHADCHIMVSGKRALDSPIYFRSFIAEPTAQRFVAELVG
jgi:hypothetical protein